MNATWDPSSLQWKIEPCGPSDKALLKALPKGLARWDKIRQVSWLPEIAWHNLGRLGLAAESACYEAAGMPATRRRPIPAGLLVRPLMRHQVAAVEHLCEGRRGLWDDMGLGKTASTIAAYLLLRHADPGLCLLVICPKRVIDEWEREFIKTAGRPVDPAREILINYDRIWREKYGGGLQAMVRQRRCVIVMDEVHVCAGAASRRFEALEVLTRGQQYVWGLSGTPVRNKPESFYTVYRLVTGAAVDYEQWLAKFAYVDHKKIVGYRNIGQLEAVVRQHCLRREVTEVQDLPELRETVIQVPLVGRQRVMYNEMRSDLMANVTNMNDDSWKVEAKNTLVQLGRLLQIAAHPGLLGDESTTEADCAKLGVLDELIAESGEQKVLVWSRYPWVLDSLKLRFESQGIDAVAMHGSQSDADNAAAKERFLNVNTCKVCCLSLGAFSEGLNLQCATIAIYHDLYWYFDKFHQSKRRSWRTGQTLPVSLYYLVGKGTIEEYVLESLNQKEAYQQAMTGKLDPMKIMSRSKLMQQLRKPI